MAQKGFYYDMTTCIGCKACHIACKDKNDLPIGVLFRKVYTIEGGKFPHPWFYHLSIGCNHCADPRCVQNCPAGAITKRAEDGLVIQDPSKCIGCKLCTWSCPYGAPQYIEEQGRSGKCNGCYDLVDQGQNPACVDACVMRALDFGDIDELRAKYGATADVVGMPDSGLTGPSIVITPSPEARR